ncbi:MAG: deoxyribonuclease IV [Candidatus Methanofastidiosia archaeon]
MRRIGAHVSIAGGVSNAIYRQQDAGGNTGQIFVSSPRTWKVSPPSDKEASSFRTKRKEFDQAPYVVHSMYLINLGTKNDDIFYKSLKALQEELNVAHMLGIEYFVFHPGAHTGGFEREEGLKRISQGLNELLIPKGTKLLLENTTGKGTTMGRTFEELAVMIESSDKDFSSLGICFDTCHAFCGGFPIHTEKGLESTIDKLDEVIGLENLGVIHLNDSKHPFDSRKDEHEHIGMGYIGEAAFRRFLNYPLLTNVPLILETPVSQDFDHSWDISRVKSFIRNIDV